MPIQVDVEVKPGVIKQLIIPLRSHLETAISKFCVENEIKSYEQLVESVRPMYIEKTRDLGLTLEEEREKEDPMYLNPNIQFNVNLANRNLQVQYRRDDNFSQVAEEFLKTHNIAPNLQKWLASMLEVRNRSREYNEGFMAWMQESYRMYENIPAEIKSPSSRKVFLDVGSRTAEFYKQLSPFWFFEGFVWYLFECNPRTTPYIRELIKDRHNVTLMERAVWIEDGEKKFWIDNDPEQADHGSSLFEDHAMVEGEELMAVVQTIDFSKWLASLNLTKDDTVVMRMDIEGAEYEVLKKMIVDGTAALLDHLDLECHASFAPSLRKHLPADKVLPWLLEGYGTKVTVGNYYQEIQCETNADGKEVCINTAFD